MDVVRVAHIYFKDIVAYMEYQEQSNQTVTPSLSVTSGKFYGAGLVRT